MGQSEGYSKRHSPFLSSSSEDQRSTLDTMRDGTIGIEREGLITFRDASLKVSRGIYRCCKACRPAPTSGRHDMTATLADIFVVQDEITGNRQAL